MITIKKLVFSDIFSYGKDIELNISNRVTQLVGPNGAGKSSLSAILEEALYNKNSRGIKKAKILNRYSDSKSYSISVYFDIDGINYELHKTASTTAKVRLLKDGEDISGHTATQTYTLLEAIIGVNFATFTKLVNQSMVSSLDFLTATDGERKKFLISLLGLDTYVETEKKAKEALKQAKTDLARVEGSVRTRQEWIDKNSNIGEERSIKPTPTLDETLGDKLLEVSSELNNIKLSNETATRNLRAKEEYEEVSTNPVEPCETVSSSITEINKKLAKAKAEEAVHAAEVRKLSAIRDTCPTCKQPIDIGDTKEELDKHKSLLDVVRAELKDLDETNKDLLRQDREHKRYLKYVKDLKAVEERYDPNSSVEIKDSNKLKSDIDKLKSDIAKQKAELESITKYNNDVNIHNSLVAQRKQQLAQYSVELEEELTKLEVLKAQASKLSTLAEAFGNKGLIAYKIESSIKIFENLINEYLQVLSDGRFALTFVVDGTKLALNLYDNSELIDIKSLSSGEFNNVSTSSLLAIRKMMTAISKVDINILFLDEVVSVLDKPSKDNLIEVLLNEHNLNSVVVSHGYTHPLANTINVTKVNNISGLEYAK